MRNNVVLFFILTALGLLSSCKKSDGPRLVETDKLVLSSVIVYRTYTLNPDKREFFAKFKNGDRFAIYRTAPIVYEAFVELGDAEIKRDAAKKQVFITVPDIQISEPKYMDWDKRKEVFKLITHSRDEFTAEEINEGEREAIKYVENQLKDNADFSSNLISEAKKSARRLLPALVSNMVQGDSIIVKFK
jgi:hypothetical protein